jgi:hypothetical protein
MQVKLYYCPTAPLQRNTRSSTAAANSSTLAVPQLVAGYSVDETEAAAAVAQRRALLNNSNWNRSGFTSILRRFTPVHVSYTLAVTSVVAAAPAAAATAATNTTATNKAAAGNSASGGVIGNNTAATALVVHGGASTALAAVAAEEPVVYTTTIETWLINSALAPEMARLPAVNEFKALVSIECSIVTAAASCVTHYCTLTADVYELVCYFDVLCTWL